MHKDNEEPIIVDFTVPVLKDTSAYTSDSLIPLKVAISAMISPQETYTYYKELLNYISKKLGKPIEIIQRKTYKEVNSMLSEKKVDIAFICSGAYIEEPSIRILAVPVCNGKPLYQAYILVHSESNINSLNELKGKTFAFTDPLSNTGRLYAVKKLKEIRTTPEKFFSETIFTYAHDNSIQLVQKKAVDGATVDGLIFEYLRNTFPERVKNIKIIDKSEYYGIPPVVVPNTTDSILFKELQHIFFTIHLDPKGKEILDKLLIDYFTLGDDSFYNSVRDVNKFVKK